jgi:hypothetical protein
VSEFASRVIVVKDGHIRSDERRTPKVVNLAAAAGGTGAGE